MAITRTQLGEARADVGLSQTSIRVDSRTAVTIQNLITNNQSLGVNTSALQTQLDEINARILAAQTKLESANNVIAEFQNQPTIPSATNEAAAEKQATATIEGTPPTTTDDSNDYSNGFEAAAAANAAITRSNKLSSEPKKETPATPKFQGGKDHRVRLKVPISYVSGIHTQGPNEALYKSQGIIFPYTPSINQDYTANYSTVPVTHSNYTQYFYKNSSVGTISLTAKITVQNEYEAEMYFSIIHLLRALTKMRYGDDDNAGSPPPVCRLFAYGDAIMNNVPVAVSSFKLDLPDNVDYFTTKSQSSAPTMSTLTLTLTPIYSRNEMQKFTVTDWLSNNLRSKGYL
jgi:hypothetical protein